MYEENHSVCSVCTYLYLSTHAHFFTDRVHITKQASLQNTFYYKTLLITSFLTSSLFDLMQRFSAMWSVKANFTLAITSTSPRNFPMNEIMKSFLMSTN